MPRIRTIKPQFWIDEELGTLPREARLLYIGLWNISDDKGVFEWKLGRIRVQLFPYDNDLNNENIETWLKCLVNSKHVIKFSENGNDFGYIPTFLIHQDIKKPSQWSFATPPVTKSTPLVPKQYPSSSTKEKEKEKEKEKLEGKSIKENNYPPTPLPEKNESLSLSSSNKQDDEVYERHTIQSDESIVYIKPIDQVYREEIGEVTATIKASLVDAAEQFGEETVLAAIKEAVTHDRRNWAYVAGVLENWRTGNVKLAPRNNGQKGKKRERDPGKYFGGEFGHMVQGKANKPP